MANSTLGICCLISGLGPGGSERVMVTLASEWARSGHRVTLLTLADSGSDFFNLPTGIRRVGLDCMDASSWPGEAIIRNAGRIRALRSAIVSAGPDVVVSFGDRTNVLAICATRGTGIPVIVSERSHPKAGSPGLAWSTLRRTLYRFASTLVVQTEAARRWAVVIADQKRVAVVPNPLGRRFQAVDSGATRRLQVLAMGRLSQEKGLDLLLKAFELVALEHPDWTLRLIGAGPEEAELKSIAAKSIRPGQIEFRPPVPDPEREFDRTAIFVLPSRFEGFPNVLIEAMARKCAVVASDCAWGPGEIITNGKDGLLVPPEDPEALARALGSLMQSEHTRSNLGAAAVSVRQRFEVSRVASQWVRLMRDAIRCGAGGL